MINLSVLNDEEYRLICVAIPHDYKVGYFKKNPKEFSKIHPGFRAIALKQDDAVKLLVKHRQKGFISSFVESVVNDWLKEISDAIMAYQGEGESELSANIHALSQSYFAKNTSAYFKLSSNTFSDAEIALIQDTIVLLKDLEERTHEYEEQLKKATQELDECKRQNKEALSKNKRKIGEFISRINDLTKEVNRLKKQDLLYHEAQTRLKESQKENESLKKEIESLRLELTDIRSKIEGLKKELETAHRSGIIGTQTKEAFLTPIRPKDMEEFKEYLGYNLESIGVCDIPDAPIKDLFISYMANCLFFGKPIICNEKVSKSLISCIANSLIGTTKFDRITFSPNISEDVLRQQLFKANRIVVLDNFLGNYNESVLFNILEKYKNKIIFLTYYFSETLEYVSEEVLSYCFYVGAHQVSQFSLDKLPNEDPSKIDEEEFEPSFQFCEGRFESILKNILQELGFNDNVINAKIVGLSDERCLCERLAFDIIPYCLNNKSIHPLNYSMSLQKYLKRSHYAKLLERCLNI